MSEQAAATWPRKAWDQYMEQVRDSIPEPDITPWACERPFVRTARYTCPFCLRDADELRVVASEDGDTFTATWKDCGHSASVAAA
ncbi:hypothetical protein JL475_00685 [Streptomyces sp. M2CJ-2]|uniref:hypothetical protein n=1 Tax=Streptomyces sp. M2CJ-2 TaxID=2803948 RepID=UPI001924DBA7|nr:hypothetical protein [Streptomyces sp. M2CJ-2]MBL3664563.1 hypothetical protein [Streptomyces sp. M2CJ-2]